MATTCTRASALLSFVASMATVAVCGREAYLRVSPGRVP